MEYVFNASARRINSLVDRFGFSDYLEIGVRSGDTLFNVKAQQRTGVDPFFAFDICAHSSTPGLSLYPITSDAFFLGLDPSAKYDISLIDGLHTYDQTYRDILSTLHHSHQDTVIIIDDTIPCDAYSAHRDPATCLRLRGMNHNKDDGRWHGDTFKSVLLLLLFSPSLSIATIMDSGNPQTVVWRHSNRRPSIDYDKMNRLYNAVNSLALVDYFWLMDNLDIYNPCTEEDALEWISESFSD